MNSDIDRLGKTLEGFDYREVRSHTRLERAYERWPLLAALHLAIRAVSHTTVPEAGRPTNAGQGAASMWEE